MSIRYSLRYLPRGGLFCYHYILFVNFSLYFWFLRTEISVNCCNWRNSRKEVTPIHKIFSVASDWKENNPSFTRAWSINHGFSSHVWTRRATITSARHLINVPSKERFPIARNLLVLDRRLVQLLVPRPLFFLFYSFRYLIRGCSLDRINFEDLDERCVFCALWSYICSYIFGFVFRIVRNVEV